MVDRDVNDAVVGIANVRDHCSDFRVRSFWTEGAVRTVVAVSAPWVPAFYELLIIHARNCLNPKHSVGVLLDDAPCVFFTVSTFCARCGSGDIVLRSQRRRNVVINGLRCHVHRLLALVRCSAHVANADCFRAAGDVRVVALHLGERLLENQGPDNLAVAQLSRPRLIIFEGDVIVDNNGLRHAENEEIDGVATLLEQAFLEHLFHAVAG